MPAQFDATLSQLWGKVDPSDGIPFRPPIPLSRIDGDERRQYPACPGMLRPPDNRCCYAKNSGWVVRVRVRGTLYNVGCFRSLRQARAARDAFRVRMHRVGAGVRRRGRRGRG